MQPSQALMAFAALSQETRLLIIKRLVRAGPAGVAAGEIAEAVKVSPSNVSFHLKELVHAGLIEARRDARAIIYSASYDTLRDLIGFLMKDCCAAHPDICTPALAAACCTPATARKRAQA
jgi:DNA-binding transcriptional ArsR family regulator